ncbi:hypothetical protein WJX81_008425 [Elliptochloris bilobata]|uniref:mannose-6-phosphate isomerase n=1 Tax=Elliptochloris bilobata TaxID=381761 RepID=A0AAW1SIB7_9CHLO
MLRLNCPVQNYAWGRPAKGKNGRTCAVAALAEAAGVAIDLEKPYAELWMGTHPSGPACLHAEEGTTLNAWLEAHPAALGDALRQRFGSDLPFLFKVLSVETALSIQSHPDKALAERLHAERPKVYKDANHKPEMAIALTDFEALCGFVGHEELVRALDATPELAACVGAGPAAALRAAGQDGKARRAALREAFTALMLCDACTVAGQVNALAARLEGERTGGRALSPKEALVLRLNAQYPADVGVLSAYFLNLVVLQPNQGIHLAANVPHAYVSGELVECMATSDNVIRAGLTPKLRDTAVLCESLTYEQGPPEVLRGEEVQQYTRRYAPPFDEFEVQRLEVPAGASTLLPANPGAMLLLATAGAGEARASGCGAEAGPHPDAELLEAAPGLRKGDVFFVPAGTSLQLAAGPGAPLTLWVAAVNAQLFPRNEGSGSVQGNEKHVG